MYERTYGNKYHEGLDITEIAKLVRQDIKDAIKAGDLPKELKTSVRTQRFSGGRSLDITIKALPHHPYNLEWVAWTDCGQNPFGAPGNVQDCTDEAEKILSTLKGIMGAYNHDGSETQVDYFDVNFYGDVSFDREAAKVWKETARAEAAKLYRKEGTCLICLDPEDVEVAA